MTRWVVLAGGTVWIGGEGEPRERVERHFRDLYPWAERIDIEEVPSE